MFKKGDPRPAGAGNKKGSKHKHKLNVAEYLEEYGISLLHELAKYIQDEDIPAVKRMELCAKLLEYAHPKLRSVEHSGEVTTNQPVVQILLPSNGRELSSARMSELNAKAIPVEHAVLNKPKSSEKN